MSAAGYHAAMTNYTAPLDEIRFVFAEIAPLADLTGLEAFSHVDPDVVDGLLEEAGRFAAEVVAPTNRDGDLEGARVVDDRVEVPASFHEAYKHFVASGWGAVQHPEDVGGGGFPLTITMPVKEFVTSANMAFSLAPMLTTGAVHALLSHGDEDQRRRYLPKMVSGEWAGTMNLTEPQAGSDVGAVTTKAVEQADGSYRLTGQKIYITFGEHDLTENIIHLVLARTPDAPDGTRGLSLFVVPKYRVDDDGGPGERNDVTVVSIEEKLGIHGSPTCVLAYGEQGAGAYAELVGEVNDGMRAMFTMMNDARLAVGLEGVAIAERAFQQAVAYARERRQGRAPGAAEGEQSRIIEHPDVRRMLLTQKASIEAARALCYVNAYAIDRARHDDDATARSHYQGLADVLTPLSKGWSTDLGVELTSLAVQVHGGMGYIEETGAAQHLRDARIAPIYEGTNGIQAIDLVGRKLAGDDGAFVTAYLDELANLVDGFDDDHAAPLADALGVLRRCTTWLLEHRGDPGDLLAGATPYLRLFATVVGGVLLAKGAAAARRHLDDPPASGFDEEFLTAKVATATFYLEQLLPQVHGLAPAVTAGAERLTGVAESSLAP